MAPPRAARQRVPREQRRCRRRHQGTLLRQLQGSPRYIHPDREELDHGLHRPLGLRQKHCSALPQPDERSHSRLPLRRPRALSAARTSTPPTWTPSPCGASSAWSSSSPNPFATSIYNNVAFGLRLNGYKGDRAGRVEKALRAAALWDEVKDKLNDSGLSLSGGQQQRLCIARAIATEPGVLLMDEPCSALDPIATRKIEELMAELKRKYTIAIVTHNLQQAQRVADKTGFLYVDTTKGGRTGYLVEFGDTNQIFTDPREKYTQDYIRGEFS